MICPIFRAILPIRSCWIRRPGFPFGRSHSSVNLTPACLLSEVRVKFAGRGGRGCDRPRPQTETRITFAFSSGKESVIMDLLQGASDDQVALIGCFVALVGSAALMYLSYVMGPAGRQQSKKFNSEPTIKPMPMRSGNETHHERAA